MGRGSPSGSYLDASHEPPMHLALIYCVQAVGLRDSWPLRQVNRECVTLMIHMAPGSRVHRHVTLLTKKVVNASFVRQKKYYFTIKSRFQCSRPLLLHLLGHKLVLSVLARERKRFILKGLSGRPIASAGGRCPGKQSFSRLLF